jgi:rod shape-determining protein MreD
MQSFLVRFGIVLVAGVVQLSFLNVAFASAPSIVLALAVAWVLILGFVPAWPWVVVLGVVTDLLMLETVGVSALALVFIAYAVSFFSRRFLVENRGFGSAVLVAFLAGATVMYQVLWLFLTRLRAEVFSWASTSQGLGVLAHGLWISVLFNTVVFFCVYAVLMRVEQYLDFYDSRVMVKKR